MWPDAAVRGLQKLYDTYGDRGFVVLGFPCDQFGHQEPGTEEEISGFCQKNYGVSFPMFAKIDVNGDDTHPLYEWLKDEKRGLPRRQRSSGTSPSSSSAATARVLDRFAPTNEPADLTNDIEKALASEQLTARPTNSPLRRGIRHLWGEIWATKC